MKRTWVEVTCDSCGGAEHFRPPMNNVDLRREGYIVRNNGKHYCSEACEMNSDHRGVPMVDGVPVND